MKKVLFHCIYSVGLLVSFSLLACQSQTDQVRESIDKAKQVSEEAQRRAAEQLDQAKELMDQGMGQAEDALEDAKKQMAEMQKGHSAGPSH